MLAALGLTRGVRLLALLGLGAVLVGLASLCVFTVDAGEYAVVTQFGKPVRVESTPGLKFKLPAPVQTVSRFDRRLFVLVPPPREFLTLGKNAVVASGFIVWKVHDPKRFMQTVFDRAGAESRLGDILFAELRAASEKAKSGILGEAYKLSQKIRGEGEARAAKIYADSLARAPEFYRFVRSMDAMKKAVDKETTLVLPVDSELFRLLQDSRFRFPEH